MKTVLVVYTDNFLSKSAVARAKKYCFNTESDLREGDMIKSKDYTTSMQVVKVLDKSYKYFNGATGELSDEFNSTAQWEIKTLVIKEENNDVVYGSLTRLS
jgi:hypothetical protein